MKVPDSAALTSMLGPYFQELGRLAREARGRTIESGGARYGLAAVLLLLLVAGLLLPPVSLITRLTTLDYVRVLPGNDAIVPATTGGGWLEIQRGDLYRATRIRLTATAENPPAMARLPAGYASLGPAYRLDIRGPVPRQASMVVQLDLRPDQQPFVDPFGWDGHRWRWLSPQFPTDGRVRIQLPLESWVPEFVIPTLATAASTEISAVLLSPPAVVPAAVAELPILELRAYHLETDDGSVAGRPFLVPGREVRLYGVVDNLEGQRVRTDLITNVLILPEARRRQREAIVAIAKRDGLDGVVLDYEGIAADLQPIYGDLVRRLADDLHRIGVELIVTVPLPQQMLGGWDSSPYTWRRFGESADGLRVRLPNNRPLETEVLDSMVRWALERVNRRRLQLALPVRGRDLVESDVALIGFGDALAKILDVVRSDAPRRLTPGQAAVIELPTMRAAELARDPATEMWRFYYWDHNRRQHTVWLNDAAGFEPVFEIAARYRLSRVALDGVAAGLDPALWRMVRTFIQDGEARAPAASYRLAWQLADATGTVVQEAIQPIDDPTFRFQAPRDEGQYRLAVNLINGEGQLAALGGSSDIQVAPPPPPTALPTLNAISVPPTPEIIVTAPPPADELNLTRAPVRVAATTTADLATNHDATIAFATAELRAGPGFQYDVLSDLRPGDRLAILARSENGKWLQVRLLNTGLEGWVLGDLLELNVDPGDLPVATPEA